jgi:hypothetical protein
MIRKLLVCSLLMALLAACGSGPTPSSDSNTAPAGDAAPAPAAGAVSSGGPKDQPAAKVEPTADGKPAGSTGAAAGGETRDIKDIGGSLDSLKSYRLHFSFGFDGKDDQGKPQKGGMEFVQEIVTGSKDQHIRWSATGDAAANSPQSAFEFFQVGGTTYIYTAEGQEAQKCVGMTSGQDAGNMAAAFKPSDMIGGLEQAKLVGKGETVNGVVADRYSFDQNALSFGTFASAQGEVWIAQDGGFLVKYVGTATGKNTFLSSKSAEGTFTWEYNLTDANQVGAIDLPKECDGQQPADDIPVPESATDKAGFGKLITFKTPEAPADVAAFYKQRMPKQGWEAGDESGFGDLQTLNYTKDGRKLSITITKEAQGGSTVMISETEGS